MKEYQLLVKGGEWFGINAPDVFDALSQALEMLGGVEYRIVGVVRGEGLDVRLDAPYQALRNGRKVVLFKVIKCRK